MNSITVRKDLRVRFGPPRDQGGRPTCLAFATSDAHAAARGPWEDLSCEYLLYHAKQREKTTPTTGAKPSSIRQALEHDGQPIESDWKYLDTVPLDLTRWLPPSTVGTVFRRASTLLPGGFDEAWDSVEAGSPVLIVMTISNALWTTPPSLMTATIPSLRWWIRFCETGT